MNCFNLSITPVLKFSQPLLGLSLAVWLWSFSHPGIAQFATPGRGIPGRREGAGSRATCLLGSSSTTDPIAKLPAKIMPLLPESGSSPTLEERPTFFWYSPPTNAVQITFHLVERSTPEGKLVYSAPLPLNQKQQMGIRSFQLPATVPPLKVGVPYVWVVTTRCAGETLEMGGFVNRIAPSADLQARLRTTPDKERPALYASKGLWYEMLKSLASLRQASPNDPSLKEDWASVLKSVKLAEFADVPMLECCRVGFTTAGPRLQSPLRPNRPSDR